MPVSATAPNACETDVELLSVRWSNRHFERALALPWQRGEFRILPPPHRQRQIVPAQKIRDRAGDAGGIGHSFDAAGRSRQHVGEQRDPVLGRKVAAPGNDAGRMFSQAIGNDLAPRCFLAGHAERAADRSKHKVARAQRRFLHCA